MSGDAIGALIGLGGQGFEQAGQATAAGMERKWASVATRHAFQRALYMSNTAYQRATADMRAAGLNPALAYQQGGASAPVVGAADVPDLGRVAEGFASGAGQAVRLGQELKLLRETVKKATADAESAEFFRDAALMAPLAKRYEMAETRARTRALDSSSLLQGEQSVATKVRRQMDETYLPGLRAVSELESSEAGQLLRKTERVLGGAVGSLLGRYRVNAK